MKMKIRKGDTVEVVCGSEKDKGLRGEVIKVLQKEKRIVIQGVNLHSKHKKQVQAQGRTLAPGILKFEAPIDISNVMFVCPKCSKMTRVGFSKEGEKTVRVCKKCEALLDT